MCENPQHDPVVTELVDNLRRDVQFIIDGGWVETKPGLEALTVIIIACKNAYFEHDDEVFVEYLLEKSHNVMALRLAANEMGAKSEFLNRLDNALATFLTEVSDRWTITKEETV